MTQLIQLSDLAFVGRDLHRPECVLCTRNGDVYVSHWGGGVTQLAPDGSQDSILAADNPHRVQPNGIAIDPDGSFLLANLGDEGGIWRLRRDGSLEPVLLEVEGVRLPPTNFVLVDREHRLWVTVSTKRQPRALGYRPDVADGFIVLMDQKGARVVADGLGYTNEVVIDAVGHWLYVNETFARRLSRFRLSEGGHLGRRETVAAFGHGAYADGLCFDREGCLWVTSIVSNRVIRVAPDGLQQIVIEDSDPNRVEEVERAFLNGHMGRPHLDTSFGEKLHNISSMAFGGPDLKTAYLGCLLDDRIASFQTTVAGLPPAHWNWT